MSFGHFAAGFADAWADSVMQKREADRRDKMAKLQGELYELQIKQAQEQQAAQGQVMDMMTGQLGEFELGQEGLGEFNITPGQTPEFIPGRNEMPQLRGDREPMSLPEMMVDAQGIDAMMRAGYITPRDLIGGAGSPNRDLELLRAAGIDPASEEGQGLIKSKFAGQDDDLFTKMMIQTQLGQEQMRLEEMRRTRQKEEKTEAQRIRGVQVDARRDIHHTREMFDLMQKLDGTALAVGNPVGDFLTTGKAGLNALMEATGWDVSKSRQMVADRKRLDKLFADGTLGALDRFAGTGTVSGEKFRALQEATPNAMVPSQSNMLLLADRLEQLLAAADIEEIDIAERNEAEQLIEALRGYTPQANAVVDGPGAVNKAKDFAKATLKELENIDVESLTDEEFAALKRRYNELRGK